MIQEIKIKNFLSFKDEVKLSFEASKDSFAEESQVVQINENTRLLRFAVVFGYNASGKTNLLKAFQALSSFWFEIPKDMDRGIDVTPFKLDKFSPNEPSHFEMVFYVKTSKYKYQLVVDRNHVHSEKLYHYKSTQPTLLFDRDFKNEQSTIYFNPDLKIGSLVKEGILVKCLKNTSFFAARNQVNASIPLIDAAMNWMKSYFMPIIIPTTDLLSYAQNKTSEDKLLASFIVDFLHAADFNITNIKTEVVSKPISEELLDMILQIENLPKEEKERIQKEKSLKQLQTVFEHTVDNERGIETSLHPRLLEKILFEYLKDNSRSQLIVATHNDGLLDLVDDLIRKDSVWFTEKKKSGVTDLYKLTDFRGVNRLSSIREAYRNKRFGATMN